MGWHKNGAGKWNLKKYARFLKGRNHQKHWTSPSSHNCQQKPSATSAPPILVAKITNRDMSEKIKSAIIKANQEGKSAVFVWQIYSTSLTERRNVALKYRADLKEQDPPIQGYVKFPAIIMIKRTGERKNSLVKEFWTRALSFQLQIFKKV